MTADLLLLLLLLDLLLLELLLLFLGQIIRSLSPPTLGSLRTTFSLASLMRVPFGLLASQVLL